MSGLTISEIRTALAAQIRDNVARDVTVDEYPNTGTTRYPRTTVDYAEDFVDYWVTFGSAGVAAIRFVLRLEVGSSVGREDVAKRMDDFLSAGTGNGSSIVDALYADNTLGLAGCTANLQTATVDPASLTAELAVEVHINKVGANA